MFGFLEGALVLAGLTGGWAIGRRARQAVHDDAVPGRHGAIRRGVGPGDRVLSPMADSAGDGVAALADTTITAMLVGSASVGKTMFCMRTTYPESLGRETLPKTVAPAWHRADVAVSSTTRVTFQLLDTPGREGLSVLCVPFYQHVNAVILVFDVGNASSFEELKSAWYAAVQQHRLSVANPRHKTGTCVVLANIVDERRERQVKRSVASSWCESVGLPYFETHPSDAVVWRKMFATLWRNSLAGPAASRDLTELESAKGFEPSTNKGGDTWGDKAPKPQAQHPTSSTIVY